MANGIPTTCIRCGRPCRQSLELVGSKPALCGHCRTNRDLSRPITCECCGETKPLAEFLAPNGGKNRNCRACIESGAVREKAYRKQSRTMRRKEHVQERAREIVWPEIVIPGDPFSGDGRYVG